MSRRLRRQEVAETTVKQDEKTGKVATTIQEVAYYNMFLTEAILELLAEKGILTGEEVLERVKKLKSESPVQFPKNVPKIVEIAPVAPQLAVAV